MHYCLYYSILDATLGIAVKALQAAITLHTNSPDIEPLSRCYHSLVQLVMSREEAPQGVEGEAWGIFTEILDLLDSKVKVSVVT